MEGRPATAAFFFCDGINLRGVDARGNQRREERPRPDLHAGPAIARLGINQECVAGAAAHAW